MLVDAEELVISNHFLGPYALNRLVEKRERVGILSVFSWLNASRCLGLARHDRLAKNSSDFWR